MEDLRFDNVNQLKWLLLVVVSALGIVYGFSRKRRALQAFASVNLLNILAPGLSRGRQIVKSVLMLSAMTAIVLALVGPRWGTYFEDAVQRRLDLMVCLDVSRSMLAEDAGMSRMDRAKDDIKRLLDRLGGGSIGLVAFAGKADLVCPLTDDYEFYRLALDDVGMHSAQLGGTNLADAIKTAVHGFGDSGPRQRAIILMTDGEDTLNGKPDEEARKAKEAGILVFTIGIGDSDRGALIPVTENGERRFLKHDDEQVWSKMNPEQLKAIAASGGGEYHPSGQVSADQRTLEWLYQNRLMPREERTTKEKRVARQYARFTWPTFLAFGLLLIECFVKEKSEAAA